MAYLFSMLILLDIDGVMVPATSWKPSEIQNDGFTSFNSRAVSNLQRILSETGASIVLTTSHKSSYSLDEWKNIFNNRGITVSEITKLDDNLSNLDRKDEIINWLKERIIEDYVIIDDDKSLNGLPLYIKEKLVLTSSLVGLNSDCADLAIKVLKSSELVTA